MQLSPPKEKPRDLQQSAGLEGNDFQKYKEILEPNSTQSKAEFTLIAKLALASHCVHRLAGGGFLVTKYGLVYEAKTFADLEAFAVRLGVVGGSLQ